LDIGSEKNEFECFMWEWGITRMNKIKRSVRLAVLAMFSTLLPVYGSDSIETQKKNYPTDKCVVSDEKLGAMGNPIEKTVKTSKGDRLLLLCCKGCIKKVDKDPETYVKKLDDLQNKK